jgi:prophage tail gpP-like protein
MPLDNLTSKLGKAGRLPPVKLEVYPLDREGRFNGGRPFTIERFTSYSFNSNILIPVDTFTFSFKPEPPKQSDRTTYLDRIVREGDAVQLTVDGVAIATGYVDMPASDTDAEYSAILTYNGRDLMGFLEENDAVNPDSTILWTNNTTIDDVLTALLKNTRIRGYELRNIDAKAKQIFATNPGESKLAALQRFLDPLNALAWMSAGGILVVGKPAFDSPSSGQLGIRMFERVSNVLRMRVQRGSGHIPNAVLMIWTGNEAIQSVYKSDLKLNAAQGPSRLYKAGHRIYRTIATSAPQANDVQGGLPEINRIVSEGANYLNSLAAREMARENVNELLVTCTVVGHLNADGEPYAPDQCYDIVYDAEGLDERMYLFGVEYALSEEGGQVTHLSFCKLNTIVSGGPT